MGEGDETRRGEGDDDDEEMEERRPPSTQSFGTSGLAARFGARKGVGEEKRSLWAVGEEDGEAAGPSRLGGHSSEEDEESGSGSSMDDETEEEEEQEPAKDSERPRTSLWGLAMDTTASQLERAGDENIVSRPFPLPSTSANLQRSDISNANSSFPLLLFLLFLNRNPNLPPSFPPKPSSPSPLRLRLPPRRLPQLLSSNLPLPPPIHSLSTAQTKTPRRQRVLEVLSRRGQIPDGRRRRTRREVDVSIRRRRREKGTLRSRRIGRR